MFSVTNTLGLNSFVVVFVVSAAYVLVLLIVVVVFVVYILYFTWYGICMKMWNIS